ncbi:MAG: hypothetical protein Q8Q73_03960 [Stagnimonas sp.]|nr:hypothetical protein [Stagnimonas sp.]
MRLSTLLLLSAAALGAGALAWSRHCQQQAEFRLRVLAAQLEPLGQLGYRDLRAWPWGQGEVSQLRLQLSAPAAARLGLDAGDTLRAERVELLEYREHDPRTPATMRLRWSGLHWPLPAARVGPEAEADEPPLSRLRALGLQELRCDGELDLRYRLDDQVLRLWLKARAPALAEATLELSLRGGAGLFLGQFREMELSRARLDYRDRGLLALIRQAPGLHHLVDGLDPEAGWSARFEQLSTDRGLRWGADDARRLREFLREPLALRLMLDPPGRLQLRNLPLYRSADLPQVLGLSVVAPPAETVP